jgi:hypothetical protein
VSAACRAPPSPLAKAHLSLRPSWPIPVITSATKPVSTRKQCRSGSAWNGEGLWRRRAASYLARRPGGAEGDVGDRAAARRGIIMGIGMALAEETVVDERRGASSIACPPSIMFWSISTCRISRPSTPTFPTNMRRLAHAPFARSVSRAQRRQSRMPCFTQRENASAIYRSRSTSCCDKTSIHRAVQACSAGRRPSSTRVRSAAAQASSRRPPPYREVHNRGHAVPAS